jgi:hypothetical protein
MATLPARRFFSWVGMASSLSHLKGRSYPKEAEEKGFLAARAAALRGA